MPKKSNFITDSEVPDGHFFDTFGNGVNRKISKENLFAQIKKKAQTYYYDSEDDLKAADLEADPDSPIYVRVAPAWRLYRITSQAAVAPFDIPLDNGATATLDRLENLRAATVDDMKNIPFLKEGDFVETINFATTQDKGGNTYEIGTFGTADGVFIIDLTATALQARRMNTVQIEVDSVSDMAALPFLYIGDTVTTLGYSTAGDGGGNNYEIVAAATGTDDGGSFIDLPGSGLQARGLFPGGNVTLKQFGAIGDGVSDDNGRVQAAFTFSQGRTLYGTKGEIYSITSINIPQDVTFVSNGCKFYKPVPSTSYTITGGTRLIADKLWLVVEGGVEDRGIQLDGGDCTIGKIRVESNTPNTSPSGSDANGLLLGPLSPSSSRANIGEIFVSEFARPVQIRNMNETTIGYIRIINFRRGVYINDCKDLVIDGSRITGLSPTSPGGPGDNGILIEASSNDASKDITLCNVVVEDSGEHGIRMGGQSRIKSVTMDNITIRRPGAGSDPTGGSGIKVLGSSSTGTRHEDIHISNITVEDCREGFGGDNFSGILLSYCDNVTVSNYIARSNSTDFSCIYGLYFSLASDVTVDGFDISDTRLSPIIIEDFTGGDHTNPLNGNIKVFNGSASPASGFGNFGAIFLDARDSNVEDIFFEGVSLSGTRNAVVTFTPDTGSYSNLRFDIEFSDPSDISAGPPIQNDASIQDEHYVSIRGPWYGTFNSQAADSSFFQDTTNGLVRIKKAGAWVTL